MSSIDNKHVFFKPAYFKLIGSLIISFSFGFLLATLLFHLSFITSSLTSPEQYLSEVELNQKTEAVRQMMINKIISALPRNPITATAICQSTGAVISSNVATRCQDPVFRWSGAESKGSAINGYLVYWYESTQRLPKTTITDNSVIYNVVRPPIIVSKPEFRPWPEDLSPGKTYYLMIQTQTNTQAGFEQTGGEIIDVDQGIIENAKPIFIFRYQ